MNEIIGILIIGITLFSMIAEIFGRSKHIGRWWAFALLVSTLVFGVVAIIVSPSAKAKPTMGNQIHNYFGYILIGFGILNMAFSSNPVSLGFIVLGTYLT